MARLIVEIGHLKEVCYNEIGLCAQIIDIILGSIVNTFVKIYLKNKGFFTSDSYNFVISIAILELKIKIYGDCCLLIGWDNSCAIYNQCP